MANATQSLDPWNHKDYKAYLRDRIRTEGKVRGYRTRLAQALGVQPSFLSHVVSRPEVHFTPEHALAAGRFWGLEGETLEYFRELVNLGRAGTPSLREHLKGRLEALRRAVDRRRLEPSTQGPLENQEALTTYYSSWHYTAIHLGLTLPELRTAGALASRLGIPEAVVQRTLEELARLGLAKKKGAGWVSVVQDMTAPFGSPQAALHAQHWAHRAAQDASLGRDRGAFHYAAVVTAPRAAYDRFRQAARAFLAEAREASGVDRPNTAAEDLVALGVHVFRL